MAIKGHMPKSFGIRRRFTEESETPIISLFKEMQDDGIVSSSVELRNHLQVTLLPRRRLDRQLKRGLVLGYEFGKAVAATQHEIKQSNHKGLEVKLGEIVVIKSKFIVHRIESPELQQELDATNKLLGKFGVKGANRNDQPPLHATLGETADFIARREQKYLEKELNEVMPVGEVAMLEDMEIYPNSAEQYIEDGRK